MFTFAGEDGSTLFTLDNHEPMPFVPEQIKTLSTDGVTLLLDVPRVADAGADTFVAGSAIFGASKASDPQRYNTVVKAMRDELAKAK